MNRKRGFTLIELMITLSLCVLVITLTALNVSFLNRGIVRSELNTLHAACMYLQQCALATGKKYTLTFSVKKNQYYFDGRTKQLDPPVIFGIVPGVKGPPSSPRSSIMSASTFNNKSIIFNPDGIISSGTIYLTDRKQKVLYALSSGIASISYLRKYVYNGKWMLLE